MSCRRSLRAPRSLVPTTVVLLAATATPLAVAPATASAGRTHAQVGPPTVLTHRYPLGSRRLRSPTDTIHAGVPRPPGAEHVRRGAGAGRHGGSPVLPIVLGGAALAVVGLAGIQRGVTRRRRAGRVRIAVTQTGVHAGPRAAPEPTERAATPHTDTRPLVPTSTTLHDAHSHPVQEVEIAMVDGRRVAITIRHRDAGAFPGSRLPEQERRYPVR